jgi:luciferase family oxidoreductase group 1
MPVKTIAGRPTGLLDLGQRPAGMAIPSHLQAVVEHAQLAEQLGFSRYWLAEHHGEANSWASPTVLATAVAQATRTIRVGAAGVLLNACNPFRVGCDYALLSHLFPDRIDLGIARASPGANARALREIDADTPVTSAGPALNDEFPNTRFSAALTDLVCHLRGTLPIEHRHFGAVIVPPCRRTGLELWLLGSRHRSAQLASREGASLALALFLNPQLDPAAVAQYKTDFRAGWSKTPRVALAVAGVCASSDDGAARLAARVPPAPISISVAGGPATCADQLRLLAERFDVEEIVWVDVAPGIDWRRDSMVALAEILE